MKVYGEIPRFAIDVMLGKVAKWLRILGYDAIYRRFETTAQVDSWVREGRIPVTRNRKWQGVDGVVFLDSNHPREQIKELLKKIPVRTGGAMPFSRCIRCNNPLRPISREEAEGKVPDAVLLMGYKFQKCNSCGRIFWPGTHRDNMLKFCNELLEDIT